MFKKVDQKQSFPKMEEEILKFWEENRVFEKSVEKNRDKKPFIFYEGPPTANGKPGLHHVLARAFKDIIPRYKTMKGFLVERKAGWDTHGLPVEIQVEKAHGIKHKHDILNIVPGDARASVIEFNKKCKESVWQYKDLWEKMTERMGYWVDMKNPYITYDNKYIESVWWTLAQIAKLKTEKGEDILYKGHKVVPYCYRCGTALASHEVAQGYQTVKDNSVYIKFKVRSDSNSSNGHSNDSNGNAGTYLLAWTTTPWTLPGNVALAVNPENQYLEAEVEANDSAEFNFKKGDKIILANDVNLHIKIFGEPLHFGAVSNHEGDTSWACVNYEGTGNVLFKNVKYFQGKSLFGLEYEPLYQTNDTDKKTHYVVAGGFVTTDDGTGIVHIAPAFGADDADVAQENDLPTLITVDEEGKVSTDVPGKGIEVKKKNDKNRYAVDDLIVEDLKARGLFFKEEVYEHEYPFCWRCDTPLIYYAKPSWYIRMSAFSDELVKNNENINWVPEYIKEGRFGEWLRGIKDWAISRERYWGTPLPIWECVGNTNEHEEKRIDTNKSHAGCGKIKVVESIEEIREQLGNPNKLFLVRHGESENNIRGVISCYPEKKAYSLTDAGRAQIEKVAHELSGKKIDLIYASPLQRTKETAEIISRQTGVEIIFDERLTETGMGKFNGEALENWRLIKKAHFDEENEYGAETVSNIRKRFNSFLAEINKKYAGKNIVVVSHGDPLYIFSGILEGLNDKEILAKDYPRNGSVKQMLSTKVDLHKPYIDDVKFKCEKCGGEMVRTPEVMDVWFDSGSMPLAQFLYPNGATEEDKEKIESGKVFPADYISEAIDQTRGWFYTLHAISTLLNKAGKVPTGNAYKNVICLAHILDKHGKKMSKSRGNVVEPMEVMDQYGADMLRWMLFTINQPGMPKKFDIKGMQDIMNRVFRMLWNSYSFFVMYANIDNYQPITDNLQQNKNLLDRWILSELNVLVKDVDDKLADYDIYAAAKSIEKYIDNLSNWYIRRSRKRFWKSENDTDKNEAYTTLHHVLVTLSQLMAPFTPFVAEEIYKNLTQPSLGFGGQAGEESVHLSDFPVADEKMIDEKLNEQMNAAREIVSAGLQKRAEAKIKVRQPLASVTVFVELLPELEEIIREELNVKKLVKGELGDQGERGDVILDAEITEELRLEGRAREIIRAIQEMRKAAGYEVDNRINICYNGLPKVFEKFGNLIAKETLAEAISDGKMDDVDLEKEFSVDGENVIIGIKKVG